MSCYSSSLLAVCNQVKLVRVAGKEGEQVYIQIGDDEMEMLTQQQAEQVRIMSINFMLLKHLAVCIGPTSTWTMSLNQLSTDLLKRPAF